MVVYFGYSLPLGLNRNAFHVAQRASAWWRTRAQEADFQVKEEARSLPIIWLLLSR